MSEGNRAVAIKLLPYELVRVPEILSRFFGEVRRAREVDHPHVVRYLGHGEDGGDHYLVLELADWEEDTRDAAALLARRPQGLDVEVLMRLGRHISEGLHALHSLGIVHRDLKPSNVLLFRGEDRPVAKVADFGVSWDELSPRLTMTGFPIGTAEYMAPEQAAIEGRDPQPTPASDVYALGVLLYELACGQVPLRGATPLTTLLMAAQRPPRRLRELRPDLPAPLERLVMRCLAKDPADRPPSAAAVVEQLDAIGRGVDPPDDEPTEAKPTLSAPADRPRRIMPALFGGGAIAVALGALLTYALWPAEPPSPSFVASSESEPRSLDPHYAFSSVETTHIRLVHETLLDYDHEGRLVPRLAEALPESSDGGRTWRFRLRSDATFSNGAAVGAADVVRSMHRMLDPDLGSPGASFYDGVGGVAEYREGSASTIAGIRVIDPRTVEIALREPDATFLHAMALGFAAVVPRAGYPDGSESRGVPVGSGPYVLESGWPLPEGEAPASIVYRRRHDGRHATTQRAERIVLIARLGREEAARRFRRGEIDHRARFTSVERAAVSSDPDIRSWVVPVLDVWGLAMNCELPPFDDVHVRRAVAAAIDRVEWADGLPRVATGQPLPPGIEGYDPDLPARQIFDLERAREEMRLAGHPDGLDDPIVLVAPEGPTARATTDRARAALEAIGIELQVRPLSFPRYLSEVGHRRGAQMALVGWTPDFPHASSFLDVSFHSRSITDESSTNRSFCGFPELDAILDRARASTSPRERRRLYRAASMVIAREAPWAFAWNSTRLEIAQPWVRGYRPHPIHEASYVDVWIDPSRGLPERRLHGEAP